MGGNTVVVKDRVEVEEGLEVLGPVSCVLARPLMERSMGEQLE